MSGIAPDVTKNDLEAYFTKINTEVSNVQFSLKIGVAIVVFDDWPGRNICIPLFATYYLGILE